MRAPAEAFWKAGAGSAAVAMLGLLLLVAVHAAELFTTFHVPKTGGTSMWKYLQPLLPYRFPDRKDSNTYPGCRPESKDSPWNAVQRSLHSLPSEVPCAFFTVLMFVHDIYHDNYRYCFGACFYV